jgi:co-chaperonin GroES (HSP10)
MAIVIGRTKIEGKIRLIGNAVLIEPLPRPTVSSGGIIIPHEQPGWQPADASEWRVLAVGPGDFKRDKKGRRKGVFIPLTDVSPGDCVLCYTGQKCFPLDDGTGRVIVQVDQLLLSWVPERTPASSFGGDSEG